MQASGEYAVYRYMTAKKLASAPVFLQRPLVEGARVQRCFPIDRVKRTEVEKSLGKTVTFGYWFSVEGATNPFTLIAPKNWSHHLGNWYAYNWTTQKFVALKSQGTTVHTLAIDSSHVSPSGAGVGDLFPEQHRGRQRLRRELRHLRRGSPAPRGAVPAAGLEAPLTRLAKRSSDHQKGQGAAAPLAFTHLPIVSGELSSRSRDRIPGAWGARPPPWPPDA